MKKKLKESIFTNKFEQFLRKSWSRPTEKNFIALIGKNKDKIVSDDGQGKEYLKALFDKNQNLLRDNCTDEFVDELNRLSTDYQTDSGDDMGMGDEDFSLESSDEEAENDTNSPEQQSEEGDENTEQPQQKPDNNKISESEEFWHGTPSGDLKDGPNGLHIGTLKAAKQALEARIGVPAEGEWDGTREYGKTLLAGRKTLLKKDPKGYLLSGFNVNAPEEDYYAAQVKNKATYGDGSEIPMSVKPSIFRVKIKGSMTNTPHTAHPDFKANGMMTGQLKKGNAKNGYYYKNDGEDAGSVSAVVPNKDHIERISERKFFESKNKKMKTPKYPASIKLKVDLWNHDASEEEIEKEGTCFVKSGATLKWDDAQKAYKSGEKIVRPGLLHPSMYDVVGEKNELSDKIPSLKKESIGDEKTRVLVKNLLKNIKDNSPRTQNGYPVATNIGLYEQSVERLIKTAQNFDKGIKTLDQAIDFFKSYMNESVYDANEKQKAIQKQTKPQSETPGFNTKTKKAWAINGSGAVSESEQLKERVGMDAEDISVRIFPTKGVNINRGDLTKILNVLNTTYSSRPKIKGKPEATELTVSKFPLSQLVNLRGDLKTISPNLDVDSVTLPNVSNNVPVDEIEESSRAENMTRNGRLRVFEDESLEDIEKIVNESYDELVNFHKDHVDIVDSWKDIQNKTKTSHTIIQEDPSEGPQEHNGDADVEDPFDDIVNITPSSKTIIETEGAGQKKVAKDIDKSVKAEQGREKSNEKKKTDQKINYYSKLNKKNEDNKKLSGASPTSLEENPSKGVQMGDKKAKEEYPWEEYGIKSEWIEEAPTQRTNFSFQELNNQKKSKEIANNKASELADKNNSLVWKIKQKIKQLEIQLQDVYMEQESDKNVLDDSTNGQNPAVIKYGRKIQGIENAINKLQNKLKSLTVNETVQNPTLTDMQHNVLDEDKSGDVWDATSTLIPHESERGGVKGNPKPIPTEVPWNKKKLKKEAKEIVGTPEGGKKGIDDRVKEQEDKDESLEETEKCYCNKEEWEEKLKELYKGKSVKFEDELYAIVAYVGDDEVGEWKDDTASGGTGKIWNSMFDTLEMIKEGNEYSVTGVVGGMQPSSDLLEYEDDEDWSPKDDYKTDMGDDAVTDECPKCHHDAYNEQRNGTMSCSYCGYSNLDECEGPILHEDMTTADMAVPDKSIELQKRKIEEIDRFFSEFVQKSCNVRGFINEGKFNLEGYMNSRPYSFQKIIFEAFNKEFYKEDIALDQVMMDEGNEWVDPHADDEDSYLTDPEFYKESDDMFPDVGNEEEIHDHLRINETDMEEENIENFKRALHAVKRGIIDLEQQFDGTDANEVSKLIQQAKMKFNLSDSMERDLRVDIFDWRNKRG